MEPLASDAWARWQAEPALYECPGKLETAGDVWVRGVLRLSESGLAFSRQDGASSEVLGMALSGVVRVATGERRRFLKKARLVVEVHGAGGACRAFDARDERRRDAFAAAARKALEGRDAKRGGGFTTQRAGIAGLARRLRARWGAKREAKRPCDVRSRRLVRWRRGLAEARPPKQCEQRGLG